MPKYETANKKRRMRKKKSIYDISMPLSEHTPVWPTSEKFNIRWTKNIKKDGVNESELYLNTHTGTHIDLPFHFLESGKKMGDLSLERLIGKAVVLEYPGERDVNSKFLKTVDIPSDCDKLLIKTSNSSNRVDKSEFIKSYIALGMEGAEWIVEKGINLVGIDYLSIEQFSETENLIHKILLKNDIIILEGLRLGAVKPGLYQLFVLPLNVPDAEGAPARAILIEEDFL